LTSAHSDPTLSRAQHQFVAQQIPILYGTLIINTVALCWTHYDCAPVWLSLYLPLLFCVLALYRGVYWFRVSRSTAHSDEKITRDLRQLFVMGAITATAFALWAFALFPYGDAYAKCHVAFYIGITLAACSVCLMNSRGLAMMVTFIVAIPFTLFFLTRDQPVLMAIGINLLLVWLALTIVLFAHYRNFAQMVTSMRSLGLQNAMMDKLSKENLRLASLDVLTGLANRRSFLALINQELKKGKPGTIVIGIINLDGFKSVNDIYGHVFADQVIQIIGNRLASLVTHDFFVSRVGGDEFGLLCVGGGVAGINNIGEKVNALIAEPLDINQLSFKISAAVGFAVNAHLDDGTKDVYDRAEYALRHLKKNRKGNVAIFSRQHEIDMQHRNNIEQCLREADWESELSMVFQPIVDITTKQVVGFEALARWESPILGAISPAKFIPIAETSGLICSITGVLLHKALQAASHWPAQYWISFNLSVHNIASQDAAHRILHIVRQYDFPPERIEFEVTETAFIDDLHQARQSIQELRDWGASIALDDFGTGGSTLSAAQQLPVNKIKIDRTFAIATEFERANHAIVRSMLTLCEDLGLSCVIEGVEDLAKVQLFEKMGCKLIQGYFFSRPLAQREIDQNLANNHGVFTLSVVY
jgi:diguanylate cyclase (GGDEF)-like protein